MVDRINITKRSYWVETGDQWGLVLDNVIDDDAVNEDQVHWVQGNPFAHQSNVYAMENVEEEETWFDGTYEWTYWLDGEWYTQMEDGAYVSFADMKPWMELEEINFHDGELGKELYEVYSNFDNKVRTFKEAKLAMYNKGKNRGYFKPKGKGKSKTKKGSGFGKPSAMAVGPSGKGYGGKTGKGSSSTSKAGLHWLLHLWRFGT